MEMCPPETPSIWAVRTHDSYRISPVVLFILAVSEEDARNKLRESYQKKKMADYGAPYAMEVGSAYTGADFHRVGGAGVSRADFHRVGGAEAPVISFYDGKEMVSFEKMIEKIEIKEVGSDVIFSAQLDG